MKKVISLGIGLLFIFCSTVLAGEEVSEEVMQTLEQGSLKRRVQEGIGVGPEKLWRVSPGFKFATDYDSNVNRQPSGQRNEDVIFNIIPSIGVTRVGSQFGILADYEMNYQAYAPDSDQNAFNQRVENSMWYVGEKFTAKVLENFGLVKTYATSEQSERRPILYNDVNPELIYNLTSKVSISSIYRNYLFHYRDSILKPFSYDQNDIGGRVYYHVTPKTDLFVEGSGQITDYYQSGLFNSQGYGIFGGAVGKVTSKMIVNLKTGFQGRSYDNKSINSYNNWVGELGLRYNLTSKLDTILIAKRGIEESVYQNVGYYTFNQIGLSFDYHIMPKVNWEAGGHFQNNRYPSETIEGTTLKKRNDSIVIADTKLTWEPFRHFYLAVGYAFNYRFSNFSVFQYVDHVVESSVAYKL